MSTLMGEASTTLPDGTVLSLVMNNPAWWAVEATLDQSWLEAVEHIAKAQATNRPPQNRVMAALLYGATRAHHADLTLDECGDLMKRHGVTIAPDLGAAINGSIPWAENESGEAKPAPAPAPKRKRGAGGKR